MAVKTLAPVGVSLDKHFLPAGSNVGRCPSSSPAMGKLAKWPAGLAPATQIKAVEQRNLSCATGESLLTLCPTGKRQTVAFRSIRSRSSICAAAGLASHIDPRIRQLVISVMAGIRLAAFKAYMRPKGLLEHCRTRRPKSHSPTRHESHRTSLGKTNAQSCGGSLPPEVSKTRSETSRTSII